MLKLKADASEFYTFSEKSTKRNELS